MRGRPLVLLALAALAGACTIVPAEDSARDGGAEDGGGGSGGAGAGGAADGGSDASTDPCQGIPGDGVCQDSDHIAHCVFPETSGPDDVTAPHLATTACPPDTRCELDPLGHAKCASKGACDEGATYCQTQHAVAACEGGTWVVSSCGTADCKQKPGFGAFCAPQAGGTGSTLTGTVLYEHREMLADKSGFGPAVQDPAAALVAVVYDGSTYVGSGYVQGDGTFAIAIDQAPTASTNVYFFPMSFDDQGRITFAVAKWAAAPGTGPLQASEYWAFGAPTGGQTDLGTQVIPESAGSGAIHIFELVLYGLQQAAALAPGVTPQTLLALWSPGEEHDCGTCYMNATWGGGIVSYGGGSDRFDTVIPYQGTDETPVQWSRSIVLHELGHYMMDTYSKRPYAGGQHSVTMLEPPEEAWSEGWASFFGQSMLDDGLYFAKQQSTSWWFQVDAVETNYVTVPMPVPAAGMNQDLGEVFVATTLWHLWSDVPDGAWDTTAIGMQRVWDAFGGPHLKQKALWSARGVADTDLVDFLDGIACLGTSAADIDTVTNHFGFPYDHGGSCP